MWWPGAERFESIECGSQLLARSESEKLVRLIEQEYRLYHLHSIGRLCLSKSQLRWDLVYYSY